MCGAEVGEGFGGDGVELVFRVGDDLFEGRVGFVLEAAISGASGDEDGDGGGLGDGEAGGTRGGGAAFGVELEDRGEVHAFAEGVREGDGLFAVRVACSRDVGCGFAR